MKMINVLLCIAIGALLIASGYLIYYNQSNEVYSKILPVVILGLGTVIATIYFSAKETRSQKVYENIVFFDGKTNTILHPGGFDLPRYYDNLFSPNQSSNPGALATYPEKADSLSHDSVFNFYEYINASLLYEVFLQIREQNKRLMSPEHFDVNIDEDLDLPRLKLKYQPLSSYVDIDANKFKGKFNYMPELQEPMPYGVKVKFIAIDPQASLSGTREMVIYRENFFEFRIKADVRLAAFGPKGYFTVRLTNTIRFERLTSQHAMTKVYKAYCQVLTNLLSTRFHNPKTFDDYISNIQIWNQTGAITN